MYKNKYLKYKNKYLELKNKQTGGMDPQPEFIEKTDCFHLRCTNSNYYHTWKILNYYSNWSGNLKQSQCTICGCYMYK